MPAITLGLGQIIVGDCRETLQSLPAASVHCVATSPPYWALRDYKIAPVVWERPPGRDAAIPLDPSLEGPNAASSHPARSHASPPLEGPNAASSHPAHAAECEHEWGDVQPARKPGQVPDQKAGNTAVADGQTAATGQWCLKCNAWLGSLGLEPTPELFVEHIVECFREVWRVLRDDGVCWVNMGDCYTSGGRDTHGTRVGHKQQTNRGMNGDNDPARLPQVEGLKPKDLLMMPARVALALQQDGWYLRQAVPWFKRAPMPESATDRMTTAHEYLFLLTKNQWYYYDGFAVRRRGSSGPSDLRKMAEQAPRIGGKHKDLDDPLSMANKDTHIGQSRGVGNANRNLRTTDLSLDVAREALAFWSEAVKTLTKGGLLTEVSPHVAAVGGAECGLIASGPVPDGGPDAAHSAPPTTPGGGKAAGDEPPPYNGGDVVYSLTTSSEGFGRAHFATFPQALVRPLILAGTSERGCCPQCGKCWERVVEKSGGILGKSWHDHAADAERGAGQVSDCNAKGGHGYVVRASGWRPGCECGSAGVSPAAVPAAEAGGTPALLEPVPCTVLDPFGGAGTVGLVAQALHRRYILCEIKQEYADMAALRIRAGGNAKIMDEFEAHQTSGQMALAFR